MKRNLDLSHPPASIWGVLNGLEILPERAADLDGAASQIWAGYCFGCIRDLPRNRKGGIAKAARSLEDLRDTLVKAVEIIRRMPIEAQDALRSEVNAASQIRKQNEKDGIFRKSDTVLGAVVFDIYAVALAGAVERARQSLPERQPQEVGIKPRKYAASDVAREAAELYDHLTGKPATITTSTQTATAQGKFLDFVTGLFEVLEINASPEAAARKAIKEFRSNKPTT